MAICGENEVSVASLVVHETRWRRINILRFALWDSYLSEPSTVALFYDVGCGRLMYQTKTLQRVVKWVSPNSRDPGTVMVSTALVTGTA
jgi:hypothetical protein